MRRMNYAADGKKQDPTTVVQEFLRQTFTGDRGTV
jgi:glycine betaine/choline ABC-type transport system substrate-binding protein